MSHLDSEVLARCHHVLPDQLWLELFKQGNPNPKKRFPALSDKHVKNVRHQVIRQEASENRHEPFRCEVVRCHLNLPQVLEKLRQVKFDQLGHLEIFKVQFREALHARTH